MSLMELGGNTVIAPNGRGCGAVLPPQASWAVAQLCPPGMHQGAGAVVVAPSPDIRAAAVW